MSLAGQHAVVTGAGRGIGAAIVQALADAGASVSLLGRDAARLAAQAERVGGEAITVDVADEASVTAAFARIRERHPRIDILVNNAGQAGSAPIGRTTTELWQRMLAVNLTGTFFCCREVIAAMSKQGSGRIINIASTAGLAGYAYVSAYVAAKHGVIGLTRTLALETARSGVTVNAICPGYTETDIVRDAVANIAAKTGKSEAEARAGLLNPQGRLVQPEEIAAAVLWLASPAANSMTGQAISISGGEVMTR